NGKRGAALKFDGSDDYVDIPNGENLVSGESSLTLSAWVKTDSINSGHPGIIVAQSSGGNQIGIFQHNGNYYYELGTTGDTTNRIGSGEPVELGEWTHVALTWDGSKMKEYINGKYTGRSTSTGGSETDSMQNLNIGRWSGGPDHFDGKIDDVRIYPYALSQEQVKQVMNGGGVSSSG
ncbi:MAG: LamG domain-containing protein, partial [Candidatus Aenigmatarchaeota archaeon]